ncbi:MAG: 30S ribosomal protein THX [Flavobacteriales bacterium]
MGKGDRKTRRGKIFRNSNGVRRPRKKRFSAQKRAASHRQ